MYTGLAVSISGCGTLEVATRLYDLSKRDISSESYEIFSMNHEDIDEDIGVAREHIRRGKEMLGHTRRARNIVQRLRYARNAEERATILLEGAGYSVVRRNEPELRVLRPGKGILGTSQEDLDALVEEEN